MDIRKAQLSDSEDIFSWRNDPKTRAASLNTEVVAWEGHQRWYTTALSSPSIILYIAQDGEHRTTSIGMCRFNLSQDGMAAEVSINLNPEFRGKNLSQKVLNLSIKKAYEDNPGLQKITATIRETNVASMKIFLSEFFIPTRNEDGVVLLERNING